MKLIYSIRHLDANGAMLRYEIVNVATEGEAFRKVVAEPLPPGCTVIEIAQGDDAIIWRGNALELAQTVH